MEKIKNFLLSMNFAMLVFFMIGTRIAVSGASVGDALALASVCGLQGFQLWLATKKQVPVNDIVAKELNDMKTHLAGLVIKNSIRAPDHSGSEARKFF